MNANQNSIQKHKSVSFNQTAAFQTFQNAHGEIPYGMTNDYMFRAVLQSNSKVLCSLICSLLHLSKKEVISIEITNPIILGESIKSKEFRLDIVVLLNDRTIINLEMQVANKLNWTNRSILYLCRSFDNPQKGQDYLDAKPAIHIGFLDYTLFEEYPEFYATYKLINIKNHHVYSDNFILSVVDLSKIDLATDEDKAYHIDYWAALFKAKTWEELKMIASKDKDIEEAAKALFQFCTDEQVRKLCRDREEYYQDLANYERVISQKDALIEKLLAENKELKRQTL
ncbi:MAG: Rpn family recombination-promoting nuclease/putative transposase [Lachnospiraceae bacterium]|nr:Rpn family recombination-promoting nuclease/putative transposase [Lachnospiraceae bacterium]